MRALLQHTLTASEHDELQSHPLDPDHEADLIYRHFVNAGHDDKAAEFSRLYARFSTLPVVNKKAGILALLRQLSTDDPKDSNGRQKSYPTRERGGSTFSDDMSSATRDRQSQYGGGRTGPYPGTLDSSSSRAPVRDLDPATYRPSPPIPARVDGSDTNDSTCPSQSALLRELPFILQGLSSSHMIFGDDDTLQLPSKLPITTISILHTLAEPALLYRRLNTFVESTQHGLTMQSLQSAVAAELGSYLGMIATLETQIRPALEINSAITLKRCVVWTRDATMGLRLMAAIVADSTGKKGGQVISNVHGFVTLHGDPFVQAFATRLLTAVTRPFYSMLRQWISSGELQDPYLEFFVCKNANADADLDTRRTGGTSLWENQYTLQTSMIPSIINHDFARKVFLIGKSLNFVRETCHDAAWVEAYSAECSRLSANDDHASLLASVDQAYNKTMAHLLELMEQRFKLFEHLSALKKFLLLGQGDFISLLMESLSGNLERPANSQYRHTLTAQLEHAIRNSNAQSESPEVLKRLDARMLELSHGKDGWDVFTLEYRIDSPLDVIITPWASKQYLKIFNFLWRVKRVEFAIGQSYRGCITRARGVLKDIPPDLADDWKGARIGMSGMVHFLCQLQYYILFEVIEAGWEGLQRDIRKVRFQCFCCHLTACPATTNNAQPGATLDDLIEAHNKYLQSITRKGLLSSSSSSASQPSTHFNAQLHELLKLILAYKDAVEQLWRRSLEWVTERSTRRRSDRATSDGDIDMSDANYYTEDPIPPLIPTPDTAGPAAGSTSNTNNNGDPSKGTAGFTTLEQTRSTLRLLETEFRDRVCVFLGDLAQQSESDMRFLGVVMNFNDAYRPVRRNARSKDRGDRDRDRDRDREKDRAKGV